MTVARPEDVEARLGRPFAEYEQRRAEAVLQDVEAEIARVAPGVLTTPGMRDRVVSVECAVTLRATRMAESLNHVTPGEGTVTFNPDTSAVGYVALRRSEWRTLGVPQAGKASGLPPLDYSCTPLDGDGSWTR